MTSIGMTKETTHVETHHRVVRQARVLGELDVEVEMKGATMKTLIVIETADGRKETA
jgi:hypothetical protein